MPKKGSKKGAKPAKVAPLIETEAKETPSDTNVVEVSTAEATAAASALAKTKNKTEDLLKVLQGMKLDEGKKSHQFWNTQPVPQLGEQKVTDNEAAGEIETKTLADVRQEPYQLPPSFEWSNCNMSDPATITEVYTLLCENYVEDDDNMFRFDYSREFLQWALKPPGYKPEWHVGVRVSSGKKKLVGFITGIPAEMAVYDKHVNMVEINFLCVHKKLRDKRLAPVLIKEITRRVNMTGVWQAVYTAGVVLPKPVAQNRYYHRSLNPKKLIEIGFSRLQARMTIARTTKLYKLPTETQVPGIRPLEKKDIPAALAKLSAYLNKFQLHQCFNLVEFEHWFMPRANVVNTYVVEDPATGEITDMCSFYTLPSTIIGNDKHNILRAAYSFYNFSTKTNWEALMSDALILAKQLDFDVFNALNVMENDVFLQPLKFGIGDGHLQYYLYNWRCKEMEPKDVGLVLL